MKKMNKFPRTILLKKCFLLSITCFLFPQIFSLSIQDPTIKNLIKQIVILEETEYSPSNALKKLTKDSPERKKIFQEYVTGKNSSRYQLISTIIQQTRNNKKNSQIINNILENQVHITTSSLLELITNEYNNQPFTLNNGDILLSLSHSYNSYHLADIIDSPYSHSSIIHIDNNIPYALNLFRETDLQLIPLGEFLIGTGNYLDRFIILRFKQPINFSKMDQIIKDILKYRDNIYYDKLFMRQAPITEINSYFSSKKFLYCTEMVFMIYEYLLNRNDFIYDYYPNPNHYLKSDFFTSSPISKLMFMINLIGDNLLSGKIITENNFFYSKEFSKVISFGSTESVRTLFKNQKKLIK